MNVMELHLLGRMLQRIGVSALEHDDRIDKSLTPAEILLISEVFRHGPLSIGDLAQRAGFVQSHVSTLCARLEGKDHLTLSVDPGDRRRTLVAIHPKMLERVSTMMLADAEPVIAEALGPDDAAQVAGVTATLDLLLTHLRGRYPAHETGLQSFSAGAGQRGG